MSFKYSRIGDLFPDIKIGGTPSRGGSEYFGGSNLWVSIRDMNGKDVIDSTSEKLTDLGVIYSNCKLILKGSLLFSFKLTVGRVAFAGEDLYTNEAIASFDLKSAIAAEIDLYYLSLVLPIAALKDSTKNSMGAPLLNKERINNLLIPHPTIDTQSQIAAKLKVQLAEVATARKALESQQQEIVNLANAIIRASVEQPSVGAGHARDLNPDDAHSRAWPAPTGAEHVGDLNCEGAFSRAWPAPTVIETRLGDVLDEIKKGIGETWADYPVLGATRGGLAPAKEQPGKYPQRYKPVTCGTVFYNPMRIMIGSIAFVDDDDEPGITSPDYVALRGKAGLVDSRWFYYWLRSPYGEQCINSLARGAVRERMLFNRLAEGVILLPPYQEQLKASKALATLKPMKFAIQTQLKDLNKIPERLLALAFENK
jgi:type I restriction enzyme S subunit